MESEDIIRAGGAVFKVWGPVIASLEEGGVGGGGGGIGHSLTVAVYNCQITEPFLSHC